jgi:MFS family permease
MTTLADAVPAALADAARVRRRLTGSIFASVAIGTTAMFAALTVAPLVALEITGSAALTGLPGALGVAGTAAGATLVSRVMARRGRRRPGLVLGYVVAIGGALIGAAATLLASFPLLLVGTVALGCGSAASNQARYAAADAYPAGRRSGVIGWILWAATIGAVAGPTLGTAAAAPLTAFGLPPLAGGFLVGVGGFTVGALAFFLLLRPDPSSLAVPAPHAESAAAETSAASTAAKARTTSHTRVALGGLVVSHCVMVLIMTMAPVHLRHHDTALGAIGLVMSSHTLGMFALAPVAGHLAQRIGNAPVLAAGLGLLALAGLGVALTPDGNAVALGGALFLLGVGWSCGFVAGSGELAQDARPRERTRRQGTADTVVFAGAAVASLGSGVLLSWIGYPALALLGSVAAVVAMTAVLRLRHAAARHDNLEA